MERDDKFVYGPGDLVVSQCRLCRHQPGSQRYPVEACPSFPGGIPADVLQNRVDHRLPYPDGDEGTVFEPRSGTHPAVLRALAHHFAMRGRPSP